MKKYSFLPFILAILLFSCGSKKDEMTPENIKEDITLKMGSFEFPEIDPQPRFYSGIKKITFSSQNLTDIKVKIDGKEVANFPESGTHEYEFDTRELEDGEVEFIYTGKQEDGEEVSIKKTLQIKNRLITINLIGSGQYIPSYSDETVTTIIQIHNNEGEILETISLEGKADEKIEIERPLGLGDTDYILSKISISGQLKFAMESFNFRDLEEFTINNSLDSQDSSPDSDIADTEETNTAKVDFQNRPEGGLNILYQVEGEKVRNSELNRGFSLVGSDLEFDLQYNRDGNFDPSNGTVKFLFTLVEDNNIIFRELNKKIDQPIDLSTVFDKEGLKTRTIQGSEITKETALGSGILFELLYTWYGEKERVGFNFGNSEELNVYGDESIFTEFSIRIKRRTLQEQYQLYKKNNYDKLILEPLIEYKKDTQEFNVIATTELTIVVVALSYEDEDSNFTNQFITYCDPSKGRSKIRRLPVSKEVREKYHLTTIEDDDPFNMVLYGLLVSDKQGIIASYKNFIDSGKYILESIDLEEEFDLYKIHAVLERVE